MNVLQILPDLNAGGVERTVLETVEALTRSGAWRTCALCGRAACT